MTQELITMDGKYKYRNGEPARVLCVDGHDKNFPVISMDKIGDCMSHCPDGRFFHKEGKNDLDLIPDVPLWEGEIWVHPVHGVSLMGIADEYMESKGYRKIKVREVAE